MQRIVMKGVYVAFLLALCGGCATAEETVICKGTPEAACRAEKTCSWVRPGKTATGKIREGYCRKKPGKRRSKKDPSPNETASGSTADGKTDAK